MALFLAWAHSCMRQIISGRAKCRSSCPYAPVHSGASFIATLAYGGSRYDAKLVHQVIMANYLIEEGP